MFLCLWVRRFMQERRQEERKKEIKWNICRFLGQSFVSIYIYIYTHTHTHTHTISLSSQMNLCGICGTQNGTCTGFSPNSSFTVCQGNYSRAQYSVLYTSLPRDEQLTCWKSQFPVTRVNKIALEYGRRWLAVLSLCIFSAYFIE